MLEKHDSKSRIIRQFLKADLKQTICSCSRHSGRIINYGHMKISILIISFISLLLSCKERNSVRHFCDDLVTADLPYTPNFMDANTKFTGEYGPAGRTFKNARNIQVDNPQGAIGWSVWDGVYIPDFHNSHNRVYDWIKKTED